MKSFPKLLPLLGHDKEDAILARVDVPPKETPQTRHAVRTQIVKVLAESWARRDVSTRSIIVPSNK